MKVLIIEDSSTIQAIYFAVMNQLGLQADFASSIADARKKFRNQTYNLVFCDINLGHPTLTGRDLVEEYRGIDPIAKIYIATTENDAPLRQLSARTNAPIIAKHQGFVVAVRNACRKSRYLAA